MKPFSFTVTAEGPINAAWASVRSAANGRVIFTGDDLAGAFSGLVSGTYAVNGQDISITVTEKPWFASDKDIEKAVKEFFRGL
jgi:hypothetical protein